MRKNFYLSYSFFTRHSRLFKILCIIIHGSLIIISTPVAASWEWLNPLPQGNNLYGVWVNTPSDVFAVGAAGTILHYDGSSWSSMTSGTSLSLYAVWGTSGAHVIAVGDQGTILRYDGSSWSSMASGTTAALNAVWGSAPHNVLAVGANGAILRYDGSSWSAMASGTSKSLYGVWCSSATSAFAVGDTGIILRYNGSNWSSMASPATTWLNGIWGSSDSNVFAVGASGTILYYNGSGWSAMDSGTPEWLSGVWGKSDSDVFAVGDNGDILHYDGFCWGTMASPSNAWLNAVNGSADGNVFTVGLSGEILAFDGGTWSSMASPTTTWLNAVWGSSGSDVFAVGNSGAILHYEGNTWSNMSSPAARSLMGIWGIAQADLFAVGEGGAILHTIDSGSSNTSTTTPSTTTTSIADTTTTQPTTTTSIEHGTSTTTTEPSTTTSSMETSSTTTTAIVGVRIVNITQDWSGENDVTLTWESSVGQSYSILLKDDFSGSFIPVDMVTGNQGTTSWTDNGVWAGGTHPSTVPQRYYKVSASGIESHNTVGIYRITVQEGMNLISLPLIPFSSDLVNVIGSQLTGAPNEGDADRLWIWNGNNYEFAWLVEDVGPPYDGKWYTGNAETAVTLGADRGAWVQVRPGHGTQAVYIAGEVAATARMIPLATGMNLVGSSYPVAVPLGDQQSDDCNLWESGATGADNEGDADRVWSWTGSNYQFHWLVDHVNATLNGTWYSGNSPSPLALEPGKGYWVQIRANHAGFTWTYPKPY